MIILTAIEKFIFGVVHAQTSTLNTQLDSKYYSKLEPITTPKTIGQLATGIIDLILYAAGLAAVIYLLYAGILYITSAGEEAAAEKGRKGITYAVIGIVVILLAFVIEKGVATIVNGI